MVDVDSSFGGVPSQILANNAIHTADDESTIRLLLSMADTLTPGGWVGQRLTKMDLKLV